jgi:undecaprenyl pyrophosphate synthase
MEAYKNTKQEFSSESLMSFNKALQKGVVEDIIDSTDDVMENTLSKSVSKKKILEEINTIREELIAKPDDVELLKKAQERTQELS